MALAHFLPNVVIVNPDNPAKNFAELLAELKKHPTNTPSPPRATAASRTWAPSC